MTCQHDTIITWRDEALRLADALDRSASQADHDDNVIDVARWFVEDAAAELRRLHAENEALQKALRRVIRPYRVDDQAWDPDAETERLYQLELKI